MILNVPCRCSKLILASLLVATVCQTGCVSNKTAKAVIGQLEATENARKVFEKELRKELAEQFYV